MSCACRVRETYWEESYRREQAGDPTTRGRPGEGYALRAMRKEAVVDCTALRRIATSLGARHIGLRMPVGAFQTFTRPGRSESIAHCSG